MTEVGPKRLLCLAASPFQVPLIRAAKARGLYVITCDNRPDNPGHAMADEWHNVSTTDPEAVLALAKECAIDAVIAYASDPAVPTAARVAEAMGIPGNTVSSVDRLAFKHAFRSLQSELGLPCPKAMEFRDEETLRQAIGAIGFPVMVKPVDASGSKGIVRVDQMRHLQAAFELAMEFSRSQVGIVEAYIHSNGPQIHGDGFVVDGRVVFACLGDHRFARMQDRYVPVATMLPSSHSTGRLTRVIAEVDRLVNAAGYRCGPINIEARLDEPGRIVILEIGPRNGGNFVPQLVHHATGVDLVQACLDAVLGLTPALGETRASQVRGCFSHYILHATRPGRFHQLVLSDHLKARLIEQHLFKNPGDLIEPFTGSHATVGVLLLRYRDREDMVSTLDQMDQHVAIRLREDMSPEAQAGDSTLDPVPIAIST
jgi:biotin carboxylase